MLTLILDARTKLDASKGGENSALLNSATES